MVSNVKGVKWVLAVSDSLIFISTVFAGFTATYLQCEDSALCFTCR